MKDFIMGFFSEKSEFSMIRLNLFWSGIIVNVMCLSTCGMYFYSEGKWDFTSQCAILSSLLLGSSMTGKIVSKGKETPQSKEIV